jgi:DNA-binding CsgD family transcriptional regulator
MLRHIGVEMGSPRRPQTRHCDERFDDVFALVRRLVERVRTLGSEGTPEDVMLDVEVEGVRCLLVQETPARSAGEIMLSPREQEIARMVAQGYPNKTIAAVLEISSWTVSTHLRRIFAKLGVRTRAAMVASVLEAGLLPVERRPMEPFQTNAPEPGRGQHR